MVISAITIASQNSEVSASSLVVYLMALQLGPHQVVVQARWLLLGGVCSTVYESIPSLQMLYFGLLYRESRSPFFFFFCIQEIMLMASLPHEGCPNEKLISNE